MRKFNGPFRVSQETTIEEVRVGDGRAYVLAGAFATRYEWFVMDLDDLGHPGNVLICRGGEIGAKNRGCYLFWKNRDPGEVGAGYIAEKFPGLIPKETEELSLVMFPILTGIFDRDLDDLFPSVKSWRPE